MTRALTRGDHTIVARMQTCVCFVTRAKIAAFLSSFDAAMVTTRVDCTSTALFKC